MEMKNSTMIPVGCVFHPCEITMHVYHDIQTLASGPKLINYIQIFFLVLLLHSFFVMNSLPVIRF